MFNQEEWWFQDSNKKIQGPFDRESMRLKFDTGKYLAFWLITTNPTTGFHSLSEYYPDITQGFLVDPMAPGTTLSQIGSKFSSKRNIHVPPPTPTITEEPRWYFLDGKQETQGPFTRTEMCEWYDNFFNPNVLVYDSEDFHELGWKEICFFFPNFESITPFSTEPTFRENRKLPSIAKIEATPSKPNQQVTQTQAMDFPAEVPKPPRFENVQKLYPSDAATKLKPLRLVDIFGQNV